MTRNLVITAALFAVWSPLVAIININDPLGNQTAPTGSGGQPTDPGFDYVGQVNGSTGVYVGNGWVLTANHVGAGTFNLDGTNYSYNGVDSHQIGGADLRLFKLSTNPMLAPLTLATTSPSRNDQIVMIGAGRSPVANDPKTWYVDTDPNPWLWYETAQENTDKTYAGYVTSAIKTKRWGTNQVEGTLSTLSYGGYSNMSAFYTDFDPFPFLGSGTTYEAQAVTNDSGSGIFIDNGSGWELAGTIVTVSTYSGQPGDTRSTDYALFGTSTCALDLSAYSSEINNLIFESTMIPEPGAAALLLGIAALSLCASVRRRA